MEVTCEGCGLVILDGERLSLFQTRHEPFYICIRRLRAENERLRTAGLALCKTLRHWHDNGGFECDSVEHRNLEIALGDTGRMILRDLWDAKAALDAAGGK